MIKHQTIKKNNTLWLLLLAVCSVFAGCKKEKIESNPVDQLPPATQTGANTFGCLVNGKVWIPKGHDGSVIPNPHILYDIGLNSIPYLNINTKQIINGNPQGYVFISIGNLDHLGVFNYPTDFNFSVGWEQVLNGCFTPAFDTTIQKWGRAIITKIDIPNHIISGTFDGKFNPPQCDTVFVTDGRFDIKF